MDEIKVYRSRWKAVKLFLLASVFVIPALWMVTNHRDAGNSWVYWASICFFSLAYPVAMYNFFDRRPQIVINQTGIFDRRAYKDFINWDTIDHAYWITVHRQPFVCLILKEEFKGLIKGSAKLRQVNYAMGFQEINISLGDVNNVDQQKLTALIINLANAKPADRSCMLTTAHTLNQQQ